MTQSIHEEPARATPMTLVEGRTVKAQGTAGDVVVESSSQVTTDAQSVEMLGTTSGNVFTVSGSPLLSLNQ